MERIRFKTQYSRTAVPFPTILYHFNICFWRKLDRMKGPLLHVYPKQYHYTLENGFLLVCGIACTSATCSRNYCISTKHTRVSVKARAESSTFGETGMIIPCWTLNIQFERLHNMPTPGELCHLHNSLHHGQLQPF